MANVGSAALFLIGSALFVAASACMLPTLAPDIYHAGVMLYIVGSIVFVAASGLDFVVATTSTVATAVTKVTSTTSARPTTAGPVPASPPLGATERSPLMDDSRNSLNGDGDDGGVAAGSDGGGLGSHAAAVVNSGMFLSGSALFAIGSVVFLPWLDTDQWPVWLRGSVIFECGSVVFIVASLLGAMRTLRPLTSRPLRAHDAIQLLIWAQYAIGSSLFVAGGVRYDNGDIQRGAVLWTVGSIFFFTGSSCMLVLLYYR